MTKDELLKSLSRQLIVSCQGHASLGNPFHTAADMLKMARAVIKGGAKGLRVNSPQHIRAIKQVFPTIPIIGIWKVVTPGNDVFITPTVREAARLVELGCEVVAVDGTVRPNRDGITGPENIAKVRSKFPQQLIMADLSTLEEATLCLEAGADIVSTTLSGYTAYTKHAAGGVDLDLIRQIRQAHPGAVINAEGRIWTPEDLLAVFEAGADIATVGTAITNPMLIAERFRDKLSSFN